MQNKDVNLSTLDLKNWRINERTVFLSVPLPHNKLNRPKYEQSLTFLEVIHIVRLLSCQRFTIRPLMNGWLEDALR